MKNGLFKIDWVNVKSAIIYGLLAMALGAVLAVANYIIDAGTIFGLDWHLVIDKGAMAALGVFVAVVSIVKNLFTTDKGNFLGAIEVVPNKDY